MLGDAGLLARTRTFCLRLPRILDAVGEVHRHFYNYLCGGLKRTGDYRPHSSGPGASGDAWLRRAVELELSIFDWDGGFFRHVKPPRHLIAGAACWRERTYSDLRTSAFADLHDLDFGFVDLHSAVVWRLHCPTVVKAKFRCDWFGSRNDGGSKSSHQGNRSHDKTRCLLSHLSPPKVSCEGTLYQGRGPKPRRADPVLSVSFQAES